MVYGQLIRILGEAGVAQLVVHRYQIAVIVEMVVQGLSFGQFCSARVGNQIGHHGQAILVFVLPPTVFCAVIGEFHPGHAVRLGRGIGIGHLVTVQIRGGKQQVIAVISICGRRVVLVLNLRQVACGVIGEGELPRISFRPPQFSHSGAHSCSGSPARTV